MAEVYTLGETMARLSAPGVGPLRHNPALDLGVAGTESNVAIGLARLGRSARWLGRVGDDEFGRLITATLRGEGVETIALTDPDAPTGLLVKERRTTIVTRVQYYRSGSAGSRLAPTDVEADADALTDSAILHITGVTPALSDSALRAVRRSVELAREANMTISFDINFRSALWRPAEAGPVLAEIAAQADLVFAGVSEARLIVGGKDPYSLPLAIAQLGPREVVVKRGRESVLALIEGELFEVPTRPVRQLDPVGAGDAFAAGYLAESLAKAPPERRLKTAASCGAFAVAVDGDWEGFPSLADLQLEGTEDVQR